MEATRQFMPEEVMERLTEALKRFGITIDDAVQIIRNAIQGIMESVENVVEILQTEKKNRTLFAKRIEVQKRKAFKKYKLNERQRIKEFWGNHEPP